jgi:alkyl sulfatase BDS1-like metallo-beta-lactamase superfamily hydrolase
VHELQVTATSLEELGSRIAKRDDAEVFAIAEPGGGVIALLDGMFNYMQTLFDPVAAGTSSAVVRYDLTLPDNSIRRYAVKVADGRCEIATEDETPATVTLSMSAADHIRMTCGQLNMVKAFMKRRIKLQGDLATARRTGTWFGGGS